MRYYAHIAAACGCVLASVYASSLYADADIKYGEWEINTVVQGLPLEVPTQTEHICLDRKHLVPGEKQTHHCKLNWKIQGNTVRWQVACENGGKGQGQVIYNGNTMHGSSDMTMPGSHLTLHAKVTGKWIAASCSAHARRLPQSSQSH